MAENSGVLELTADIVAAFLSNNTVAVSDVPSVIASVHQALNNVGTNVAAPAEQTREPFVPVRASVKPDHVVCLQCGSKQKMLKRHLQTVHGLSPEEYRAAYGLVESHPLVAPNYTQKRRELAKSIGLGIRGRVTRAKSTKR